MKIIDLIRNANINNHEIINVESIWPGNNYFTVIGNNVQLPNGQEIDVAIGNPSHLTQIMPKYNDVGLKFSYQLESKVDVIKGILAYFFPDFSVDEEGKKRIRIFQFFAKSGTKPYLSISVDENDANNLGFYLFGDKWNQDFVKTDKSWVLYLYSPNLSNKFEEAAFNQDILECRRLSYYALTHQFKDKPSFQEGDNDVYGNVFENNYAAKLRRNITGQEGVSVYLFKITNGMITMERSSIDFGSNEGNQEGPFRDKYYPVDIKLFDGDNQPALGNNFYGNNDFVSGRTLDISAALGPLVFEGGGIIEGYLRGFGYNQFQYKISSGLQASTELFNLSAGVGIIEGKYQISSGIPNPTNFQGPGKSYVISASDFRKPISLSFTEWIGYDDKYEKVWTGRSVGLSLSIGRYSTIWDNIKPGTAALIKTITQPIFPAIKEKTRLIFDTYYNK